MRHELLVAAAEVFEDGRSPFCEEFLSDNSVTFDESMDLADAAALGLRILAWAQKNPQQLLGAVNGMNVVASYEILNAHLEKFVKSQ